MITYPYKCHSCGHYQVNFDILCRNCGVNNKLKKTDDAEILTDIANTIREIYKMELKKK